MPFTIGKFNNLDGTRVFNIEKVHRYYKRRHLKYLRKTKVDKKNMKSTDGLSIPSDKMS